MEGVIPSLVPTVNLKGILPQLKNEMQCTMKMAIAISPLICYCAEAPDFFGRLTPMFSRSGNGNRYISLYNFMLIMVFREK